MNNHNNYNNNNSNNNNNFDFIDYEDNSFYIKSTSTSTSQERDKNYISSINTLISSTYSITPNNINNNNSIIKPMLPLSSSMDVDQQQNQRQQQPYNDDQHPHNSNNNNGDGNLKSFNDLKIEFEQIRNNLVSLETELSKGRKEYDFKFDKKHENQLYNENLELKKQNRKYKENEISSEKRLSLQEKYLDEYKSNFNRVQEEIIQIQETVNNFKELYKKSIKFQNILDNDRNLFNKINIELKNEIKILTNQYKESTEETKRLKLQNQQLQSTIAENEKQLAQLTQSLDHYINKSNDQTADQSTIILKLQDQISKQIEHYKQKQQH